MRRLAVYRLTIIVMGVFEKRRRIVQVLGSCAGRVRVFVIRRCQGFKVSRTIVVSYGSPGMFFHV
ncbi:hypothetical protein B5V03_34760 [Bradyrhizobium betae]|uniref:Uncharacterized protein n=1 Tax=Bradyrhizobium betae TaxID=244734 RepID=A0A4Q1UM24_9BRAD|nr:hypothetical protein B5V03_34760 [Bradyrhizobium betae]